MHIPSVAVITLGPSQCGAVELIGPPPARPLWLAPRLSRAACWMVNGQPSLCPPLLSQVDAELLAGAGALAWEHEHLWLLHPPRTSSLSGSPPLVLGQSSCMPQQSAFGLFDPHVHQISFGSWGEPNQNPSGQIRDQGCRWSKMGPTCSNLA